jgi:hypothetical protein
MKGKFLSCLFLSVMESLGAVAAERSAFGDLSPTPMIAASHALREYVAESQPNPTKARSAELAIVSLSAKLIVERWRVMHQKDPKSRDAVLAAVDELEQGVNQLFGSVSSGTETLDRARMDKLKAAIDAALADFRLRLKTTFFQ